MPNLGLDLQIESASLRFSAAAEPVYQQLSINLQAGQWTCLLGPSGCGKSSLLRQLAGLIEPKHQSELKLTCSLGENIQPHMAWMGQQDLLFPWLSVIDNVCVQQGLTRGRIDRATRERGMAMLRSLGLEKNSAQRPESLSGGMRQRVALARTLMQDKPLVLMDEPFSALDAVNRHKLQNLAAEKLQGRTVLLVTHDPQEALRLAHQIVLFCEAPAKLKILDCPDGDPPRRVADLGPQQQRLLAALGVTA